MAETTFIPGHETADKARRAAMKQFAFSNGAKPVEGVHFHLIQNEHGRWHFADGRAPKAPPAPAQTDGDA